MSGGESHEQSALSWGCQGEVGWRSGGIGECQVRKCRVGGVQHGSLELGVEVRKEDVLEQCK
eukprot:5445336-Pyramimonas_sp.AAC.1